jgi:hypothetical protein
VGRQEVIERLDLSPGETLEISHLTRRYGESRQENDGSTRRGR